MQYSQTLLDDIRAAVDIVDLVSRFVNLRKAGSHWKRLCPFHTEKTPSFTVNPRKSIFHCFGCGVGGDAFGFVMRQDRLSFPEAVRALAKLAGRFFADTLWKPAGERARAYFGERGIDTGIAGHFGLGYAPEGWESLITFMKTEKVSEEALIATGLAVARENRAGAYDRFRGRLLFPIRDLQGRVVAFGGRGFGDEKPKYLNSPETPLYTKGNLLYAADLARPTIQSQNRALLVEGYVDCIMAHQHGFTGTVAALGTAFTPAQLALLRRYCDEVVTFFDADAAGQKAAERAEELLEPTSGGFAWAVNRSGAFDGGALRVKVALLPTGHDPDTFLRAEGAPAFAERIAGARSLLSYSLERTIRESDGTGPRARTNAFARVALMLSKVGDAQEAATLSREAATRLGVDATQLWIEAQRLSASLRKPPAAVGAATNAAVADDKKLVTRLVTLLLVDRAARAALLPLLDAADVSQPPLREIVDTLKRFPEVEATALLAELPSEAARHMLAALMVDDATMPDASESIEQFQRRLRFLERRRRVRALSRSIAETQSSQGVHASLEDDLLAVQQDSAGIYEHQGGSAQVVDRAVGQSPQTGPQGPQGVQAHE